MGGQGVKKAFNNTALLIALCWIVYTCSYLGKLGYNANITQIEKAYSLSHATAGMVSTFFFFAYGIGQIVNGIFCKKYNVKWFVFGSLLISGLIADKGSWNAVFWLLFSLCVVAVGICVCYGIVNTIRRSKNNSVG